MYLLGLNRLIDGKGQAAGIEEWEIEEAKDLFLPVFSWSDRESWFHASTHEVQWGADRVLTQEVAEAARNYMQREWLRDEALDWLLADAMTFGEVNATFKAISPLRFYFRKGEPNLWMLALNVIYRLLLWASWLLLLLLLYSESELMAAGMVLATIAYQYAKRKRLRSLSTVLASMRDTYGALDGCPPSWRNLYALMEKSRDLGVKWPTQLYRLVERNLSI